MKIQLCLTAFLFIFSVSQNVDKYDGTHSNFCGGRIYDPFLLIPPTEIVYICTEIKKDGLFLIAIKPTLNIIGESEKSREIYLKDAARHFEERCQDFDLVCQEGFLISFYPLDKEIVIHPGSSAKIRLSVGDIQLVRMNISNLIHHNQYLEATKTALQMIRNFSNRSSKVRSKEGQIPEKLFEIDENLYFFIKLISMLIVIAIVIFLAGLAIPESIITTKPLLVNYSGFLINFFEQLSKSKDSKILMTDCMICTKPLHLEGKKTEEQEEKIIFDCQHAYHKLCQETLKDFVCLLCSDQVGLGSHFTKDEKKNTVSEERIKVLSKRLSLLYSNKEIEEFFEFHNDKAQLYCKIFKATKSDLLEKDPEEEENEDSLSKEKKKLN